MPLQQPRDGIELVAETIGTPRQRQFERHRARRDQRGIGLAEGLPFARRLQDDFGLLFPAGDGGADKIGHMRHGGQEKPQAVATRAQRRHRLAEGLQQAPYLAAARARQQKQRLFPRRTTDRAAAPERRLQR